MQKKTPQPDSTTAGKQLNVTIKPIKLSGVSFAFNSGSDQTNCHCLTLTAATKKLSDVICIPGLKVAMQQSNTGVGKSRRQQETKQRRAKLKQETTTTAD